MLDWILTNSENYVVNTITSAEHVRVHQGEVIFIHKDKVEI